MNRYSAPEYHELEPPETGMCSGMSNILLKVAFTVVLISVRVANERHDAVNFFILLLDDDRNRKSGNHPHERKKCIGEFISNT